MNEQNTSKAMSDAELDEAVGGVKVDNKKYFYEYKSANSHSLFATKQKRIFHCECPVCGKTLRQGSLNCMYCDNCGKQYAGDSDQIQKVYDSKWK